MKLGEVWLAALDPTVGSEIQKTRPCLIVSPDWLNEHRRTRLVAPLTSKVRPTPFRIATRFRGTDGLILPEQLRTVDRQRLIKRLGRIDEAALAETLRVLREMFSNQPQ